jgi:putative ATP-binding cassette transporter
MIVKLLLRYKWVFLISSILSTISAFAGVAMMKILSDQIASLSEVVDSNHGLSYFLLTVVAVILFGIISQYMLARLGAYIVYDLQNIMGRRLLRTPYERLEKMGGHKIMATLGTDVATFSNGIMMLPTLIFNIVTVVLCFSYMFYYSVELSFVVLTTMAVIIIVAQIITKIAIVDITAMREISDSFFHGLRTLVDGCKELSINANRKHRFYNKDLSPIFTAMRDKSIRVSGFFIILDSWTGTLVFGLIGAVVYGSGYFPDVSIATVIAFSFWILYMVEPIDGIIDAVEEGGSFLVAYRKVESLELGDDGDIPIGKLDNKNMPINWKTLRIENMEYSYQHEDGEYAFSVGPLNLTIERGQTYFLTGGNGSGKSTFAKLLVGLYEANSGAIYLDDKCIGKDIPVEWYRANFSTIFSDFFLFDHALDANGDLADDALVHDYISILKLNDKVSCENGVLSSTDLSQGQKKRLALLLSYIEDSAICVYDEWAADQDPFFRKYFYSVLLPEQKAKGKTMIVITHDDHYFHLADQQIKFDDGKLELVQTLCESNDDKSQ